MKASVGFAFFLLFLAGFALVNLRNMGEQSGNSIPTVADLAVAAWRPSHIGEMTVDAETDLFVQFEIDGKLGGFAGCNRFFGNYQLHGDTIQIEPLGATRMACPAGTMSFEISLIDALQSATTVVRADQRMVLRNKQGQATARFDAIDRQGDE